MPTIDEQVARETLYQRAAGLKEARELKTLEGSSPPYEWPHVRSLLDNLTTTVALEVEAYQNTLLTRFDKSIAGKGTPMAERDLAVYALDNWKFASLIVRCAFHAASERIPYHKACRFAGTQLDLQLRWEYAREYEAKRIKEGGTEPSYNRVKRLENRVWKVKPRSVKKWLKKIDAIGNKPRVHTEIVALGHIMFSILDESKDDAIHIKARFSDGGRLHRTIELSDDLKESLNKARGFILEKANHRAPMIIPPKPWVYDPEANKFQGGYMTEFNAMSIVAVKDFTRHTVGTPNAISPAALRALNTLQETPWAIDKAMAMFVREAYRTRHPIVPVDLVQEIPDRVGDDAWGAMSDDERTAHKSKRRAWWDEKNREEGKHSLMRRLLFAAEDGAKHEAIYFPHSFDFRFRMYPGTADISPQGTDVTKSTLKFANGVPLGREGLEWLLYGLAGSLGYDKLPREEQLKIVNDRDLLEDVADDPLGNGRKVLSDFKDEEPFMAVAYAREILQAVRSGDPASYVSHMPVNIDGSCNGLQHLSAMALDEVGAAGVNLVPSDKPADVYQQVASALENLLPEDSQWQGRVTRSVVKRAVMTTPYGVTAQGVKDQLVSDGMCNWSDNPNVAAHELTPLLLLAISQVVKEGKKIMGWFQMCAEEAHKRGCPISWTTPVGTRVTQCYDKKGFKVISTVLGSGKRRVVHVPGEIKGGDKRKMVNSISPNIVHSFDAAHAMMTINKARQAGITSFSAIHDSFGTHAGNLSALGHFIREAFVEIYREDWLTKLHQDFLNQGLDVPNPYEYVTSGNLDIEQVLESEYFFA